ncbi:MAG TPA: ATP-binding domain-containing protein [Quisquiliibacterium sp.]|nr:ATP-binding domain-containing protein [Quisquiliibacterium sp.]
MARILPEEIDAAARRGHAVRELETLERLERELPDEYTVYHGVHWARADENAAFYGEIDFLVANRTGRLLAIEQKNGEVSLEGGELVKHYATGPKRLRAQVSRNVGNLMREFGRRFPGRRLDIDHLFYLPDHELRGPLPASIEPDRVVDARSAHRLAQRIVELFDERPWPASSRDTGGGEPPDPGDVHLFLSERVEVAPSVDAIGRLAREHYARLSGGLATWARRLEMQPFRLRVAGTAGSGKTQLALDELRAAKATNRTALYVCFNRALADAMRRAAPAPDACLTFHELAAWSARSRGEPVDFSAPGAFDRLAEGFVASAASMAASVDLLLVDEGQDFEPAWGEALLQLAKPDGRCLWLEDPAQNLYRRAPMTLPAWPTLRSPVNYRSPHVVVTLIDMLGLVDGEIRAGGAVHGFDPQLDGYGDDATLQAATDAAVRRLLAEGHAPADIAVITWRGLGSSKVAGLDTLAGLPTRRFTGRYADDGEAIVSEGLLQLETLFRFKGQAADCVVITEVDFDSWNDDARTRLFVALTRARLKVALVASERVVRLIEDRLR